MSFQLQEKLINQIKTQYPVYAHNSFYEYLDQKGINGHNLWEDRHLYENLQETLKTKWKEFLRDKVSSKFESFLASEPNYIEFLVDAVEQSQSPVRKAKEVIDSLDKNEKYPPLVTLHFERIFKLEKFRTDERLQEYINFKRTQMTNIMKESKDQIQKERAFKYLESFTKAIDYINKQKIQTYGPFWKFFEENVFKEFLIYRESLKREPRTDQSMQQIKPQQQPNPVPTVTTSHVPTQNVQNMGPSSQMSTQNLPSPSIHPQPKMNANMPLGYTTQKAYPSMETQTHRPPTQPHMTSQNPIPTQNQPQTQPLPQNQYQYQRPQTQNLPTLNNPSLTNSPYGAMKSMMNQGMGQSGMNQGTMGGNLLAQGRMDQGNMPPSWSQPKPVPQTSTFLDPDAFLDFGDSQPPNNKPVYRSNELFSTPKSNEIKRQAQFEYEPNDRRLEQNLLRDFDKNAEKRAMPEPIQKPTRMNPPPELEDTMQKKTRLNPDRQAETNMMAHQLPQQKENLIIDEAVNEQINAISKDYRFTVKKEVLHGGQVINLSIKKNGGGICDKMNIRIDHAFPFKIEIEEKHFMEKYQDRLPTNLASGKLSEVLALWNEFLVKKTEEAESKLSSFDEIFG